MKMQFTMTSQNKGMAPKSPQHVDCIPMPFDIKFTF